MFRKYSSGVRPPPTPKSPPPRENASSSASLNSVQEWKIDVDFISKAITQLPTTALTSQQRNDFLSHIATVLPNEEWIDFDFAGLQLGIFYKIFPSHSTLDTFKWVFWTDNALNSRLTFLLLSLDLASRNHPEFQLRVVEGSHQILAGSSQVKKCIIAIDFGSTHSGYAYSLVTPPQTIHVQKGQKQPTCALFDKNLNIISYGNEARDFFMKSLAGDLLLDKFSQNGGENNFASQYLYFDGDIKMRLWNSSDANPNARTCKTLGGDGGAPLLTIVAKILNYIKTEALDALNALPECHQQNIKSNEVLWVLTVPAIWRDQDKQFMRKASYEAGLIHELESTDLILALEPECAALAAKSTTEKINLEKDSKLLTFDCGGGTVDVCALQVLDDTSSGRFSCKQLLVPSGGDWGGKKIDDAFFAFIEDFMGHSILERLSKVNPAALIELMEQWDKLKCTMQLSDFLHPLGKRKVLDLSHVLMECQDKLSNICKRFNAKQKDVAYHLYHKAENMLDNSTLLLIPNQLIVAEFFDPTLDLIVNHAKFLFQIYPSELSGLQQVLLVGGVGQCPYLRFKFEKAFPSITILHSSRSSALVEVGAVKFGQQPLVFRSRKARLTLGLKTIIEYRPTVHRGQIYRENKYFDRVQKKHYIRNVFKPFLVAGEDIDIEQVIIHKFGASNPEAETVKFDVYTCDERKPVEFITQDGCRLLARMVIPVVKGEMNVLECCLKIGFTEISAEVRREDTKEVVIRRVLFEFHPSHIPDEDEYEDPKDDLDQPNI
jgi:hypothetical protein